MRCGARALQLSLVFSQDKETLKSEVHDLTVLLHEICSFQVEVLIPERTKSWTHLETIMYVCGQTKSSPKVQSV